MTVFMPMEKPKDKGEVQNCVGAMLGLVGRSDEVVIGTTERVVKARIVPRMPVGQRGDAVYAKSIRCVPWQPNPAEAAEASRWAWPKLVLWVRTDRQFQSWSRGITKPVGSTSGETWSSRSTDSPMIAKDAVWRRWALKRNRIAKDAVNASNDERRRGPAEVVNNRLWQRESKRPRRVRMRGRSAGACRRVGNVHQRDDSDPHGLRARHRSGLCDRLDERQRGPAEVVCDGATSLVGRRTTVCGNKSCSGPRGPR